MEQPFAILRPFAQRLAVSFIQKGEEEPPRQHCVDLKQVHGARTVIVREPSAFELEADGAWTDRTNLTLTIRAADCQAFVAYHPAHNLLGVLHAGWRGLNAGAIPAFLNAMHDEWKADAHDLYVAAAPSLCQKCAQFTNPLRELLNLSKSYFEERCVDLQRAATDQFFTGGVAEEHFERSPDCTCCRPDRYWTSRGSGRLDIENGKRNLLVCSLLQE